MSIRADLSTGRGLAIAAVALLTGCAAIGPNYSPPHTELPAAYANPAPPPAPDNGANPETWWRAFDDATLDGLVERALTGNLDVATAVSRLRQARDQVRIAHAATQPTLGAGPQASETRLSRNGGLSGLSKSLGGGGGRTPVGLPGTNFETYQLGFDAGWELDVFGGARRGVEAAGADVEAAQWSLRDAKVSLSAEVAADYFALRHAQARLDVARDRLQIERDRLTLTTALQRHGLAGVGDVSLAQARLAEVAAAMPSLEQTIETEIDALGVLLGDVPESLRDELLAPAALPHPPDGLPAYLPSDLVRRRPDIRRAERQLAAATARVGEATADLYPTFNLLGSGDLISTSLANLVGADSLQGSASGAIRWPILDGGRARAGVAASREVRLQAEIAYRGAILAALRDVEDARARYDSDRRQGESLDRETIADEAALNSAAVLFRSGKTGQAPVLDASAALLDARARQLQAAQALSDDVAALYKALGGGWSTADAVPPSPRNTP